MANTRNPCRRDPLASIVPRLRPARAATQALREGGGGMAAGGPSTSASARRAISGSLVISSSTPARAAAATSAAVSIVKGTTRRPAACALAMYSGVSGHWGETQSYPAARAVSMLPRLEPSESRLVSTSGSRLLTTVRLGGQNDCTIRRECGKRAASIASMTVLA